MGTRQRAERTMKLAVLVFALCGCAMGAQFMAPPAGSMQEIAAQEQYFTKTSKLVLGLQQAYYWQHYGQIEALKSYKAGRFESGDDPVMLEEDENVIPKVRKIPAIPQNKEMGKYLKENAPHMLEQFGLVDADGEKLEMASTSAKIAALKFMQVQLYLASSDVQKSYWTTKLMQAMAPPELAMYGVYKTFLSTVALSVMMQIHDVYTLEACLDNFNDEFSGSVSMDVAEATAEYTLYSSWTALTYIKVAMLYIDYVEMQTTVQAMQAAGQPLMPNLASMSNSNNAAAQSLLELKSETKPVDTNTETHTESKTQFTSPNPAQAYQSMVTLQYYVSLLKYYNLLVEMQLASTGTTVASYKLMGLRILTNGDVGDDEMGYKLDKTADTLESVWLPQMYAQWGQITMFTYVMEGYLMYTTMTISTQMTQLASFMSNGADLMTQMQSVEAANAMESMNF